MYMCAYTFHLAAVAQVSISSVKLGNVAKMSLDH